MGAAAFVMSQFIGISYIEIAVAAALPAILYYLAVGVMVHMEAKRLGLQDCRRRGFPRSKGPRRRLAPSPAFVCHRLPAPQGIHSVTGSTRMHHRHGGYRHDAEEHQAQHQGYLRCPGGRRPFGDSVSAACACAGIIIGVVTLTVSG